MAPIGRKRITRDEQSKARKKQRVERHADNSSRPSDAKIINLESLPWTAVEPEQLEDAEGFFGLEEISDVDVLKDPAVGRIEYRVCELGASQANRLIWSVILRQVLQKASGT